MRKFLNNNQPEEKGVDFYDQEYFTGDFKDKPKRGNFSLVEIGPKHFARLKFLLRRLQGLSLPNKPWTIIDVGGGAAIFDRTVRYYHHSESSKLLTDLEIITIDLSRAGIELVKKEGYFSFIQTSAYSLPFSNETIDGAIAWDLFEHLKHPEKALREISRCLKSKGFIYVVSPNPEAYTRGTSEFSYLRDKSHIWPPIISINFFSSNLKLLGFRVIEIYTRGFPESQKYLIRTGDDLILRAEENPNGTHLIVFAQK